MINLAAPEIWFVCGSQHLYGLGPLKQVAGNAAEIAAELSASRALPLKTVFKLVATTPSKPETPETPETQTPATPEVPDAISYKAQQSESPQPKN